ncbi:MAG: ornithine cyclodeaminase [Deltaproteobacteria bacterium]|nr:ornithine cyclodeaminase [Deltaproteobacteria bacterium]
MEVTMQSDRVEFLFLSQEEMIEAGVLDMSNCLKTMEEAFRLVGEGDFLMSGPTQSEHGTRIWFPSEPAGPRMPVYGPDRRFMALVGYLGGDYHVAGEKWYGSNIENPVKHGLPRSVLMVVLNDPDTCAPLAVMDGNLISSMRTGAVIGLGAKYLSGPGANTAGIVGAGIISKTCLMAIAAAVPSIRQVKVLDIDLGRAKTFAEEMGKELGLDVRPVSTLKELVEGSDVVSTAAAGETLPKFSASWLKEGAFLGISDHSTVEENLWLSCRIVADYWPMHLSWRNDKERLTVNVPWTPMHWPLHQIILSGRLKDSDIINLGDVVSGKISRVEAAKGRTIMATGGMVIEDLAWGWKIYRQASEKGLGNKLKLWEKFHWS